MGGKMKTGFLKGSLLKMLGAASIVAVMIQAPKSFSQSPSALMTGNGGMEICSCHDYGPPPPLSPEQQPGEAKGGGGSAGGGGKDDKDAGGKEGGSGSDEKESPMPPVV